MKYIFFFLLACAFVPPLAAEDRADKAIEAVRVLCLVGTGFEIEIKGDASISIFKKGVNGELRYSQKNQEGIVDVPDIDKRAELDSIGSVRSRIFLRF